jgi:hypothetical protein
VCCTAASGFLACGRTRLQLVTSVEAREQMAAVILQKYFRMWMAQANLIRLQLNSFGKSSESSRIVFPQQIQEVLLRQLFGCIFCKSN